MLRVEVGLEALGEEGEDKDEYEQDQEYDGGAVHDVADTGQRGHCGADNVSGHAEQSLSLASLGKAFVHCQGVGDAEYHASRKKHRHHAYLEP